MNRRILLQLSGPAAAIGVLLFIASVSSVWSIQRLQRNLSMILADNVTSLEAAQELEVNFRQMRFHSFMAYLDPSPAREALLEGDSRGFEAALELARSAVNSDEEEKLVSTIERGYARYKQEIAVASTSPKSSPLGFVEWADQHPVRHLQQPCKDLFKLNKELMEQTATESEEVGMKTQRAVLLLGILGPISGLAVGYAVSKAWSRSIARLSVRLHDVHSQLDRDVGELELGNGQGWEQIDRQLDRVVMRVKDATEQLQRQQQELLRAERLAALGQLAASVAHEIRNPLTGIKMLIESALRPRATRSLAEQDLQVIHREVLRLEQSVQSLLSFARLPDPQIKPSDLREIVQQAVVLMRPRAHHQRAEFDLRLPAQPVLVKADPAQISTVLVNLFLNALDAMSQAGRISVECLPAKNGFVSLRVCDSGPGLPANVLERLFQPFVTTKPHGTGLGLSLSSRILQEHGGTLDAVNRPEGGACFTLSLPLSAPELASENATGHR